MKKTILMLSLFALSFSVLSSCEKSGDNDPDNTNKIPDAVFSVNVSGAENYAYNFTLAGGTATDNAVNGSHLASQQMLSVLASSLPITWMYSIVADVNDMKTGTYNLKTGISAFNNPSQTNAYLAESGSLTITKATLFQNVGSIEDWYIDGTFSGTYQDNSTPAKQVTISGSFSGVNIKAQ